MTQLAFRITDAPAFLGDLDGFCDAHAYDRFAGLAAVIADAGETFLHEEENGRLRFSFAFLRVVKPQKIGQPILVDPGEFVEHPAVVDDQGNLVTAAWTETIRAPVWDLSQDGVELEPAIDRGLGVNVKISPAITPDPDAARYAEAIAAAVKLEGELATFFSSLPTVTNNAPAPLVGGQTWHTTGATTLIDPAPQQPRAVWS